MKQKSTHGGPRQNSGPKAPNGKRLTRSVCLTPDNLEFFEGLGKEKNNWLNLVLDRERLAKSKSKI